ncbi:MAG: rubrerythrin family protein [Saprospiraceae bacterium]|nr:rubrerythrin family protein [Saprospiraceae bacterium]
MKDPMKNIQTEIDASYLYSILARNEDDKVIASVFEQMSEIEKSHAVAFLKSNNIPESGLPQPSWRARTLHTIGKIFGYDYILGVLLDTEKSLANSALTARLKMDSKVSLSDTAHVKILQNILKNQDRNAQTSIARFEKSHRSIGGNALRAAVLGGNDGLISNFSLVMGIAGATGGKQEVLIAGLAGLMAGALSMAMGEWISVKSSQELYENQMELEMEELEHNPEGEEKELALIYITKGIPEEQARRMAAEVIADKEHAHEILIKEELGINPEELKGSPMEAAFFSFVMFAIGAIIPVIPYFFMTGSIAILTSCIFSALGLFLIGASITLFTGKNVWYSGFRQILFGLVAAGITYGIGSMVGANLI